MSNSKERMIIIGNEIVIPIMEIIIDAPTTKCLNAIFE